MMPAGISRVRAASIPARRGSFAIAPGSVMKPGVFSNKFLKITDIRLWQSPDIDARLGGMTYSAPLNRLE